MSAGTALRRACDVCGQVALLPGYYPKGRICAECARGEEEGYGYVALPSPVPDGDIRRLRAIVRVLTDRADRADDRAERAESRARDAEVKAAEALATFAEWRDSIRDMSRALERWP